MWMLRIYSVWVAALIALCLLGAGAWAQDGLQDSVQDGVVAVQDATAQPFAAVQDDGAETAGTVEALTARINQFENDRIYREAVREARLELSAESHGDLSIMVGWLGLMIGIFAIAVTIGVALFALRIEKSTMALVDVEIAKERKNIETAAEAVQKMAVEAKTHSSIIERASSIAADFMKSDAPTDEERDQITNAAESIANKKINELDKDELSVRIGAVAARANWSRLADLAVYMIEQFDDDDAQAFALFAKAYAIGKLGRPAEEIAVYDDLIERFGASDAPALLEQVAGAMNNKGVSLGDMDRPDEEIAVYDDLIKRFGASDAPALLEQLATAMFNKGSRLGAMGRPSEEIALYDDLIKRFEVSEAPALLMKVAMAMVNKGVRLAKMGRPDDEIAVYDDLIKLIGESDALALQEPVAKAMNFKGITLGQLDKHKDAIAVYDELIKRFEASDAPALLEQVAKAMFNKGGTLGLLDRHEDAIAVYDELIKRLAASEAPAVMGLFASAMYNKACALARMNDCPAVIAALGAMKAAGGDVDCQMIAEDGDFDAIRDDPAFVAWLIENGCGVDEKAEAKSSQKPKPKPKIKRVRKAKPKPKPKSDS